MTQSLSTLALPLSGLRVIEASAGTGKTWTLSALYVRLVLGHGLEGELAKGLNPPEILVMTFTEMATAELRGRIRERLHQAALYFQKPKTDPADSEARKIQSVDDDGADDFLRELKGAIPHENWAHCAKRLDLSAQWMDEASIFTIHAWSSRMLKEHAFDSKSLFEQSLTDNSDKLKLAAAQQYWRRFLYPLTDKQIQGLKGYPQTPKDLLDKLKTKFSKKDRQPDSEIPKGVDPLEALKGWDVLQERFDQLTPLAREVWSEKNREFIKSTILERKANGGFGNYRSNWLPGWFNKMLEWHKGAEIDLKVLEKFSVESLQKNGWSQAHDIQGLGRIDELCAVMHEMSKLKTDDLLDHAAHEINLMYEQTKSVTGEFDYSDLLKNLYNAVHAEGSPLAKTIRRQYPVALVDEFQDTDPWQYGTLKKIYVDELRADSGLIIIGDPKQAIYGFRGADLDTYLKARSDAQGNIYNLPKNYRSTRKLVSAVNHIFSSADNPFKSVDFVPVEAAKDIETLKVKGLEQPAMTVWYSKSDKPLSKDAYNQEMAEVFASQMVELLNNASAEPNQMAVLVKDFKEAGAIRDALAKRGLRSVYLSDKDSVYASDEALELRSILSAVANPKSTPYLRAAIATRIWGLKLDQLEDLMHSEVRFEGLIEKFHQYQTIWQKQGFLPMLNRLIHENHIAHNLLTATVEGNINGERVLTNLLHLGDLLQNASLKLHGEGALIRYLEQQLRDPRASGDASIIRLESEANLVKVITVHKSKGLEFPLVFLPFVSNFKAETKNSDRSDSARIEEDIRLLYVALTRAQKALWMGVAPIHRDFTKTAKAPKSAVSVLLRRETPYDLATQLMGWNKGDEIVVSEAPKPTLVQYLPVKVALKKRSALTPVVTFNTNWWIASFSSVSKGISKGHWKANLDATEGAEQNGELNTELNATLNATLNAEELAQDGGDELTSLIDEKRADAQNDNSQNPEQDGFSSEFGRGKRESKNFASRYDTIASSSAFGSFLHELLEWQFDRGWPIGLGEGHTLRPQVTQDWDSLITRKSLKFGLNAEQKDLLVNWISKIVTTDFGSPALCALPTLSALSLGSLQLCKKNQQNAWSEMGFTLPVKSMSVLKLDELITSQVLPTHKRPALRPNQLNGMLTGFIDLVFEDSGRYFVLDYKSNMLKGYQSEHLSESILNHRYDVQYVFYVLALHRLLKSRLEDYDYDTHIGGAVYLFLRGVDFDTQGVFVDRPPKALILSIDDAFRGG